MTDAATPELPPALVTAPVVLAQGESFRGVLAIPGPARIEGFLAGQVVGPGPLFIAPGGRVEADLDLETVFVAGEVQGHIVARARIELLATASVVGDLQAPTLLVAEGSHWNGRSRTGSEKTPA